jgi:cytoskeleton protein RodZ
MTLEHDRHRERAVGNSRVGDSVTLKQDDRAAVVRGRVRHMAKGSFGERLKREREMREVSLDELTKATRISERFLEALENEDWKKLPGGVFGRGFVRTIAGYLGLDEESFLSEYDMARGDVSLGAGRHEDRIPPTPAWIPILAVLLIGAALVGLFFAGRYAWRRYAAHHQAQSSAGLVTPPENTPTLSSSSQNAAAQRSEPATTYSTPAPAAGAAAAQTAAPDTAPLDLSVSA